MNGLLLITTRVTFLYYFKIVLFSYYRLVPVAWLRLMQRLLWRRDHISGSGLSPWLWMCRT